MTIKKNKNLFKHKSAYISIAIASLISLGGCDKQAAEPQHTSAQATRIAPGAPGTTPYWSYSGKTGIGTSYEQYHNNSYSDDAATGTVSKVWFSLAQGVLTETMFGLIHEAQIQEAQFFIAGTNSDGSAFLHEEKRDLLSSIDYLHKDAQGRPLSLAFKVVNRDKEGRYEIEKHFFTNPDNNSLMMKVVFRAFTDGITPYLYINPHVNNTGINDQAWLEHNVWFAAEGKTHLAISTNAPVAQSTVGFAGVSDGLQDLIAQGKLINEYNSTGATTGNVAMTLALPTLNKQQTGDWEFVFAFGHSKAESLIANQQTRAAGYKNVLAAFNGEGERIGWQDYLQQLPALESLAQQATDGGKLLYASAMVLKAQEDKTHAGALIASLSTPWGDQVPATEPATGYKAVWPRDFYQVAMAMLALGDRQTPLVAFEYLQKIQAGSNTAGYAGTPGWFLQKTQVDGALEWVGVQLDQTAMPIMLGHRLWREGVLNNQQIELWYQRMLKPAADFLVDGGTVDILWNKNTITPPITQQERWEEQGGYSLSTTAAIIAGLVAAADIATQASDSSSAKKYLAAADKYSAQIETTLFTTSGVFNEAPADGQYFLRISANDNPNDKGLLEVRNGQEGLIEDEIIDGGFLELVRYGVRPPMAKSIVESLPELDNLTLDDTVRVKYTFNYAGTDGSFPGWRRYGKDGYGEGINAGGAYTAHTMRAETRGRVWPIFTGERGHYELASALATRNDKTKNNAQMAQLRNTYIKGMELYANEGLMLPEQVWDGVGSNQTYQYTMGKGTNSATPLAWSHAEYIKLLRSYSDQKIWDINDSTANRFSSQQNN
jgi:glucoamylase